LDDFSLFHFCDDGRKRQRRNLTLSEKEALILAKIRIDPSEIPEDVVKAIQKFAEQSESADDERLRKQHEKERKSGQQKMASRCLAARRRSSYLGSRYSTVHLVGQAQITAVPYRRHGRSAAAANFARCLNPTPRGKFINRPPLLPLIMLYLMGVVRNEGRK